MSDDKILNSLGRILDREEALKLTDSEDLNIEIPKRIRDLVHNAAVKQENQKSSSKGFLNKIADVLIPENNSMPSVSFGADGSETTESDDPLKEELQDEEEDK